MKIAGREISSSQPLGLNCKGEPRKRAPGAGRKKGTKLKVPSLEEFFWARVDKSNAEGCWLWTGQMDGVGYGKIVRVKGEKARGAHRVAWELQNKLNIPPGLYACHTCDNRRCVRPDHIFIGSQAENIRDAKIKGRLNVPGHDWQKNKTHCAHGHPYSEENTYRWKNKRICRTCHMLHERQRRERLRCA